MLHRLALAAALALPVSAAPQLASAEVFLHFCGGGGLVCRDDSTDPFSERNSTFFDLGIEVNKVTLYRPEILRFMSTLSQRDQYVLVLTCTRLLNNRTWVKSWITLDFCEILLQ